MTAAKVLIAEDEGLIAEELRERLEVFADLARHEREEHRHEQ